MINWLNIFKHLLPRAEAWRLIFEKQIKQFFEGLGWLGESGKEFFDDVFDEINPQKTTNLPDWERQWGLGNYNLTEQQRRDRLEAEWKATGGQSPQYIQDTLQAAGFDVYVHEWWEPSIEHPAGGSVNGDVTPVARNPFDYIDDGSDAAQSFLMTDGAESAQDGDELAQDGSSATPPGYLLVNKILEATITPLGDGSEYMQDGGDQGQDGDATISYDFKQYTMPADPNTYPYYLYVGGQTFPDLASVTQARREEFEDLCLKICPTEQWLGILVNYT